MTNFYICYIMNKRSKLYSSKIVKYRSMKNKRDMNMEFIDQLVRCLADFEGYVHPYFVSNPPDLEDLLDWYVLRLYRSLIEGYEIEDPYDSEKYDDHYSVVYFKC